MGFTLSCLDTCFTDHDNWHMLLSVSKFINHHAMWIAYHLTLIPEHTLSYINYDYIDMFSHKCCFSFTQITVFCDVGECSLVFCPHTALCQICLPSWPILLFVSILFMFVVVLHNCWLYVFWHSLQKVPFAGGLYVFCFIYFLRLLLSIDLPF